MNDKVSLLSDRKQDRQLISLLFALSFEICQPQSLKAWNLSTWKVFANKKFVFQGSQPEVTVTENTFRVK